MSTQHHSDDLYGAYASGSLDPALHLLIETQAALKTQLKRKLDVADAIAASMLESSEETALSATARDRAHAAIDMDTASTSSHRKAAARAGDAIDELVRLPEPIRDRALEAAGRGGWKYAGTGLRLMPLQVNSSAEMELLRIEPGCGSPTHTHDASEYTLVLSGGFTDEFGSYGPGDISIAGPAMTHRPIADPGEICFALAVRDGGLRFQGMLGFFQRLLGK